MLSSIVWRGFGFVYASVSLLMVLLVATVRDGALLKRPKREEVMELQIGRFERLTTTSSG